MKLRTLEHFEGAIDRDMSWRRHELVNLKAAVRSSRSAHTGMMVRAGIALLYAHFEGFVGNGCRAYVEFVGNKGLTHRQLAPCLVGIALKTRMNSMADSISAQGHLEFAEFVLTEMDNKARLAPTVVSTRSNLSSTVLKDLAIRVGLDYRAFELREKLVDESLLRRRNNVAHGEYLDLDSDLYVALHDDVMQLIDDIRVELLVAARSKRYLASASLIR